ncbi:MAG: hypothetical protein M3421_08275 [Bacteroidota bacterium]|jgi:hypothetical protein|nr:hypothetical protein [Bacteroidota bacterium]
MSEYDQYLRLLLSRIPSSPNITDEKYVTDEFVRQLSRSYGLEVFSKIKESLRWSMKNPDYNFKGIMEEIPHSNREIYQFLKNIVNKL